MYLLALCILSCASRTAPEEAMTAHLPPHPAATGVADSQLAALLVEHWEAQMEASPLWATELGDHRFDDRLGDPSPGAHAAWMMREADWLVRAREMDELQGEDATTRALFEESLSVSLALEACQMEQWSFSPRQNFLGFANYLVELHPISDQANLDAIVARTGALGPYLEGLLANLQLGLDQGLVANAASTEKVLEMVETQLGQPLSEWPPLQVEPDMADPEESARATYDAVRQATLVPLLKQYRDFLKETVLPAARPPEEASLTALSNGSACYAALIRKYTTRELAPDAIHATGLASLEGIHAEFQALGDALWGETALEAIFTRLRTDPALFFDTEASVEAQAVQSLAGAAAAMPSFFDPLPAAQCTVRPIPAYEAPYTTIAYYRPAAPDGSRPGTYFVNTHAPTTRPRHEAQVLAFHESIPGHHLQIAIAQELPETPLFRKHLDATVFVEGWALYTERLADEMGLYDTDLDRMGMLSFDAWRAARLVVDTGLHHKGWSREQAEQFLRDNTPLALNNIHNEVDRYITWPGQALAYKTGQLEIWRLRREAEAALGADFDLKGFHHAVLGKGPVPLSLLEKQVQAWVGSQAMPRH
jgi:uncharacterized protein (DUF885 family)